MSLEKDVSEIQKLVEKEIFKPATQKDLTKRFNDPRAHLEKELKPGEKEKILVALDRLIARTRKHGADPFYTDNDKSMIKMYLSDAADYDKIKVAILRDKWQVVADTMHGMDTAARDELPKQLWGLGYN